MRKALNILFSLILVLVVVGCKDEVKSVVKNSTASEAPTVTTHDVSTLVSDSGVTKYRITSPVWYIYEESAKPHWTFPEGLHLEEFDTKFKTVATFSCDSAIYYKDERLWKFNGNVKIWNANKELILTNELYWNQNQQKVYSDSFIHIERMDRILEGYGFESNERLTTYKIHKPSGIFPIQEMRQSTRIPTGERPQAHL